MLKQGRGWTTPPAPSLREGKPAGRSRAVWV